MLEAVVTQNIETPTAAHIHRGAAGVPGPVVIPLNVSMLSGGTVAGISQGLVDEIVANPGNFYVNVHNASFGGGAVRGQLIPLAADTATGAQFVPVVGKVTGAADTNFVTDVRIINQSATTATVTLDYFQQSLTGQTSPTATTTITIAPGEQRTLDDIIGVLGSSGLGALRVTSNANVEVLARVLNDLRSTGQGTTGFSIGAGTLADVGVAGTLGFLSQSSTSDINAGIGFRTNIGYFNPNEGPVTATFTARRISDGAAIGTRTLEIPGRSFVQQGAFELINTVSGADVVQPNFYVTWTAEDGPLFVYAAIVDNETGDSVVVQ